MLRASKPLATTSMANFYGGGSLMSYLSYRFPELENGLYLNLGYVLTASLCPEIGIVLSAAEVVLGYPVEGMVGDEIAMLLKQHGNTDLAKELRSAITIYNSVFGGL
jgi:hypothetical protein